MINILFHKIACLFGFHDIVPTVHGKYKCRYCEKKYIINDFGNIIDLKSHSSTRLHDL